MTMAIPVRTPIDDVVETYLETRYPGILHNCIGWEWKRTVKGGSIITLQLVYNGTTPQEGE
jgi:hypothetical protein